MGYQDAKREPLYGDPVSIVVHSTPDADAKAAETAAVQQLSEVLRISTPALRALLLKSKVIDWTVCQVVQPLEGVMCEVKLDGSCLPVGRVVVAGDFLSQSSFLGCYCSAYSA